MCVPYDKIILKAQHINLTFTWLPVWPCCKTLNTFDLNSSNVTHFFQYFYKLCTNSSPVSQTINGWKLVFIKRWIISNKRFWSNVKATQIKNDYLKFSEIQTKMALTVTRSLLSSYSGHRQQSPWGVWLVFWWICTTFCLLIEHGQHKLWNTKDHCPETQVYCTMED